MWTGHFSKIYPLGIFLNLKLHWSKGKETELGNREKETNNLETKQVAWAFGHLKDPGTHTQTHRHRHTNGTSTFQERGCVRQGSPEEHNQ